MNYLGIDYGLAHLGLAFSDGTLATPLGTIPTSKASQLLPAIIDTHKIDTIIIGRPNKSLKLQFEKLINLLRLENCELVIVDETLSSYDARVSLSHTTRSRRKSKEHSAAATIILQSWLDDNPQV